MDQPVSNDHLLGRITDKRGQVDKFLKRAIPRKRRLLNITIVGGTVAAAMTAGPALGGTSFTAWLTKAFSLGSPSWQLLCLVASVASIMATVSTQLLKSHNVEEHVTRAQRCRAKLEVLEIGLAAGHLNASQATSEYLRCVEEAAFLEGA
jgi:MFS family permease